MPNEYGTRLEDLTAEKLWGAFRDKSIPKEGVDPFLLERIQEAFLSGAYSILMLELRLRREPKERGIPLMDRLRAEHDMLLMLLGKANATGGLVGSAAGKKVIGG